MQIRPVFILIGTFWPLAGVLLALFIASLLSGWQRWLMLFAGPVLFLAPCYIFFEEIGYNGNMLFVALMGLVFALAFLYYPLLAITGLVLLFRRRGPDNGNGADD